MATSWQKHAAPFLKKALKQAAKSFVKKTGMTAAKKRAIKQAQKQRDSLNAKIKRMKNGGK